MIKADDFDFYLGKINCSVLTQVTISMFNRYIKHFLKIFSFNSMMKLFLTYLLLPKTKIQK